MKNLRHKLIIFFVLVFIVFAPLFLNSEIVLASASLTVIPDRGGVSTPVTINGSDFPPNTSFFVRFEETSIGSGTTDADGKFFETKTIPSGYSPGTHIIIATAGTDSAQAVFELIAPEIEISPSGGGIGTPVTIIGKYFAPNTNFSITFEQSSFASGTTDNSGQFMINKLIPSGYTPGTKTFTVTVGGVMEVGYFEIYSPNIYVSPAQGKIGTLIKVSGLYFVPNNNFTIKLEANTVLSGITNTNGTFDVTLPPITGFTPGSIKITVTVGDVIKTDYFKLLPAEISIYPYSGTVGTQVQVQGQGFNYSQEVSIYFADLVVAQTTSDSSGNISAVFNIPKSPVDVSYIIAKDSLNNASLPFEFKVIPYLQLFGPERGIVGTLLNLGGNGFSANSFIDITLEGASWSEGVYSDSLGSFTCSLEIKDIAGGEKRITAIDANKYSAISDMSFFVEPSVTISGDSSREVGASLTIYGRGFLSGENNISILLGNSNLGTVQCNKEGSFDYNGQVPEVPSGRYQITTRGSHFDAKSNSSISSILTIKPIVLLEPNTGNIGMQISVKGKGFNPKTNIKLSWDSIVISQIIAESDVNGSFIGVLTVPECKSGEHNVVISDGTNSGTAIWIMENTPPPIPLLLSPQSGERVGHLGGQTPTFNWTAVDDLSGVFYYLSIANDEQFSSISFSKEHITANTYTLIQTESLKKGLYFWRVKAIDGAGNESQWTNPNAIQIGDNLLFWLLGIFIPLSLLGLTVFYHFSIGLTSQKRKQLTEARKDAKIKKQTQREEDKKEQEYLEKIRGQIHEMARQNRGGLTIESIVNSLKIDHETVQRCLEKMNVKHDGKMVFFPNIEKHLKK